MKYIKTVGGVFSAKVFTIFIAAINGIVTARFLPPHYRGLWALIVAFPHTLQAFNNFGFSPAIVYASRKDKTKLPNIFSTFLFLAVFFGVLTAIIVSLLSNVVLATFLKGITLHQLVLASFVCIPLLIILYMGSIIVSLNKFGVLNYLSVLQKLLALCGISFVLIVLDGTITKMLYAWLSVLMFIASCYIVIIILNVKPSFKIDRNIIKTTIPFALKSYFVNITGYLHYNIDKYLIAYFLTPSQVAFYTISAGLAELLFHLPDSAGFVLYPALLDKSKGDMGRSCSIINRNVLFLNAIISIIIVIVGRKLIIFLYGQEYKSGYLALPFMMPGVIFISGYKVLSRYFMANNQHEKIAVISILSLVLNIVLNILLIPSYKIIGAAVATSITYGISFCFVLFFFYKSNDLTLSEICLIRKEDLLSYISQLKLLFSKLKSPKGNK